jgi:hypothetical protein
MDENLGLEAFVSNDRTDEQLKRHCNEPSDTY